MIFLADLPSPVHGMANVNLCFLKALKPKLSSLRIINTAPSFAHKLFPSKLWVALKFFHMFFCLLKTVWILVGCKNKPVVYRSINGGIGQIYDLLFFLVFRFFNVKVYIHHHSFQYITKKSLLSSCLFYIAKGNSNHIVLGNAMRDKLVNLYSINDPVEVLSNTFTFNSMDNSNLVTTSDAFLHVSHLANICEEKGVLEFIGLYEKLLQNNVNTKAFIAGPISDEKLKIKIKELSNVDDKFNYLGPVYGKDKDEFFQKTDIFVFPSKYKNEAEPLVLYEAAVYGAFCIGSNVGCMEDVLTKLGGVAVDLVNLTPDVLFEEVMKAINSNQLYIESKHNRVDMLKKLVNESNNKLLSLVERMIYESETK